MGEQRNHALITRLLNFTIERSHYIIKPKLHLAIFVHEALNAQF